MSESAPLLSPVVGVSDEQLQELLDRGKQRGHLGLDDVLDVFRHVEFTPDVYERVRLLLDKSGIVLDESLEAIVPLEAELGRPVIASNQATLWYCLRLLGLEDELTNLGRLFALKSLSRVPAAA